MIIGTRPNSLLKILKTLEFDYIDIEKYNQIAINFFDKNKQDVSIFSSLDVGGLPKKKGKLEAVDDYFFVINGTTKKGYAMNDSENTNHSDDSDRTNEFNKIKKTLEEEIDKLEKGCQFKTITIIRVYSSIAQKNQEIIDNESKILRSCIQKKVKDKHTNNNFLLRDISYESFVIPNDIDQESIIKIDIEDRIRSLEQEYAYSQIKIKGYVFTASVDSIISLYDTFGDELFDKNVRIGGVTDYMGVDDAIKMTYCEAPQEFWFYNNGISLLIESEKDLDMRVFNCIKFKVKDLQDISVINGAQTIKAVSEAKSELKKDLENRESPNVLLRVYFYKNSLDQKQDTDQQNLTNDEQQNRNVNKMNLSRAFREFSEKVTISLNKQKPIKQADLAYMTDFVKNIQELKAYILENVPNDKVDKKKKDKLNDFIFEFVRRGESSSICSRQYQLDVFAKIVRAYLQKLPGSSRSKSYASLLNLKRSNKTDSIASLNGRGTIPKLSEDKTFVSGLQEPWDDDHIPQYVDIFLNNYSPVNFAMSLKKFLEDKNTIDNSKTNFEKITDTYCKEKNLNEEEEKALSSFANYGILFMVAAVIHSINGTNQNFSEWEYSKLNFDENCDENNHSGELTLKKLREIITRILEKYLQIIEKIEEDINDSNYWKTDDLIDKLLKR